MEFSEFATVPSVGCSNKVACDTLQLADVVTVAFGALMQIFGGILISAVQASVTVVVDRTVANVVLVHQVNDVHDSLWIVGSITVNLNVEDVSTTSNFVIRCLDLGLVLWAALVVNRHVITVGVVNLVGYTGNLAKVLAVATCKLAAETLGWSCKDAVVVLVQLAVLVDALTHVRDNFQSQFLAFLALTVMLACEGNEALGKSNETNTQCALVDDTLDGVGGLEVLASVPQLRHEQWELLGKSRALELEAVVELACSNVKHSVKLLEELINALLLVLDFHALYGQSHDVDG